MSRFALPLFAKSTGDPDLALVGVMAVATLVAMAGGLLLDFRRQTLRGFLSAVWFVPWVAWQAVSLPVRWTSRTKWWRMFVLRWKHHREEKLLRSMHLLPDEEEALRQRAAARFIEEADEIFRGGHGRETSSGEEKSYAR